MPRVLLRVVRRLWAMCLRLTETIRDILVAGG